MDYTIIHPGGLVDSPGGVEEIVLDVDDHLGKMHSRTRISREDLADLCVAALTVGAGQKVSFDCITRELEGQDATIAGTVIQPKSAEELLSEFLQQSKTANYAI